MVIFLLILCGVLSLMVWFLAKEMLKKFQFLNHFAVNTDHKTEWFHTPDIDFGKGMYNVVLRAKKPFIALIGVRFQLPFSNYSYLDIYGYVESDGSGKAVFSTYLGGNLTEFVFLTDTNIKDNPIDVGSSWRDQHLIPTAVYPPHFWQRLGFFS